MRDSNNIDLMCINTMRTLSIDAIQTANSDTVLVRSGNDFRLVDERHRGGQADGRARESNYEPVPEGA